MNSLYEQLLWDNAAGWKKLVYWVLVILDSNILTNILLAAILGMLLIICVVRSGR